MNASTVAGDWVALEGGTFRMGSDRFYPEEAPVHRATVRPFQMSRTAVTNRQFAAFVAETGYVTVAERPLDPRDFPGAAPPDTAPGSLVFEPTAGPVDLRDWRQWWRWREGANWRAPRGPGSSIHGLEDHPVVQVAYADALAYAQWAGARLPTEPEWEFAARGGLDGATYAWGEDDDAGSRAKTWQGAFPYRNDSALPYTAPVGSFPPNGYGLHEMTGNTWEWTSTPWTHGHAVHDHCAPSSGDAHDGGTRMRVVKGGSHLCAPEYCLRYRPSGRSPQTEDSATTHLGFRLARDHLPTADGHGTGGARTRRAPGTHSMSTGRGPKRSPSA